MTKIFLKFRKIVEKYDLINNNDNILLSFSGGPDSTALALLLIKLQKYINFKFSLIYFNHNLRDDSKDEEKKVREFANNFSLKLIVRHFNNLKSIKSNIEEIAREQRYDLLEKEFNKGEFTKIATAHNLNDLVETFFMRLFRGSGSEGLSSIPVIRENIFIRPLIEIKKTEILSYLDSLKINYVSDKTNEDTMFLRNKIRHILIPLIQKEFNPAILNTVRNAIDILKYNDSFINKICEQRFLKLFSDDNTLDFYGLIKEEEEEAIKRGIIRKYIKRLKGNLRKINYKHIESILSLKEGQRVNIPGKTLTLKNGKLKIYKKIKKIKFYYKIDKLPYSIRIKEINKDVRFYKSDKKPDFDDSVRGVFDYNKISLPIIIRNRQPGDRYRPLGLKANSKKIKEVLIDKKTDRYKRDFLPLFINGNGNILWMQNLSISEDYKTTKNTKEYFIIEIP